jgi:activator of 2-hydroxyglutaryl-CoA dehydratase
MKYAGLDVGSTTIKALVCEDGQPLWKEYKRHNTKQAEMVLEFLDRMQAECGFAEGADRIFLTGSGAGLIAPLIGGKFIQEVVAVSAAVEKLHPEVNFVSEIGGEDMKTLFFTPSARVRASRSTCSRRAAAVPGPSSRKQRASCRFPPSNSPACRTQG